jgi:hypothetical protein
MLPSNHYAGDMKIIKIGSKINDPHTKGKKTFGNVGLHASTVSIK